MTQSTRCSVAPLVAGRISIRRYEAKRVVIAAGCLFEGHGVQPIDWEKPVPLHKLPTYVDFRFTGNAVSSLESLGGLCQIDNDLMDFTAKAKLIELARLKAGVVPVTVIPLP